MRKTTRARLNPYQVNRIAKHFEKKRKMKSLKKGRSELSAMINIEKQKEIMDSVIRSPKKSCTYCRRRAQETGITPTSLRRILK